MSKIHITQEKQGPKIKMDIWHLPPGVVGFSGGSDSKEWSAIAGDSGSVPGSGRSPGEGNDYLLQFSCLENAMDRGAWLASAHGVAKRQTRQSNWHLHFFKAPLYLSEAGLLWTEHNFRAVDEAWRCLLVLCQYPAFHPTPHHLPRQNCLPPVLAQ